MPISSLLLPEGTLDYFDLVGVKESVNEVVIYLEEKNICLLYTSLWKATRREFKKPASLAHTSDVVFHFREEIAARAKKRLVNAARCV